MGKLLPLAACAFLLVAALLYVGRERGEPRSVEGATSAASLVVPDALAANEAPSELADALRRSASSVVLDQADPAGRVPVARPAPTSVVHGRVVEARTGAAVPDGFDLGVVVRNQDSRGSLFGALFHKTGMRLGPGGTFEARSSHPERLLADVVCWTSGAELERHEPHAYAAERQADGAWRIALDVGWLARVELVTGEEAEIESAGLIELVDGIEREWGETELLRAEPALVLCRAAAFEPDPAHRRWLQVETNSLSGFGGQLLRVEVPVANGIQAETIRVPLPLPTTAHGRVLDEHGEPWASASVQLLPWGGGAVSFYRGAEPTDADGRFEFPQLTPGAHWFSVSTQPFTADLRRSLEIVSGPNDVGEFVISRAVATSFVRGFLTVSAGERAAKAIVVLTDSRTGLEVADDTSDRDGRGCFVFADVPAGRYELDVIPLDERRYRGFPRALEVPCAALEFRGEGSACAELEVRDAESGELLTDSEGWALRHQRWVPIWKERETRRARSDEPLVVLAPDHRPEHLERLPPSGVVALARGWGELVHAVDLSSGTSSRAGGFGPPLAGVRVLVEGREVATTDAAGLALVGLRQRPMVEPDATARGRLTPFFDDDLAFEREGYRLITHSHAGLVLFTREP